MEKRDYYEVLGVSKNATDEEISKAYKKLSLKYHPDRQAGKSDAEKKEAEDRFKECAEAAEVLRDKEKRARYDQFGFEGSSGGFGGGFSGFDPMEFFRKMHGGFGMGGGMFGGFGFGGEEQGEPPRPDSPEDGQDVQTNVRISFGESVRGCEKEFELPLDRECPDCGGTGAAKGSKPSKCAHCGGTGQSVQTVRNGFFMSQTISACPKCGGSGWTFEPCRRCGGAKRVPDKRKIKVSVPAGICDGARLRLKGAGRCGVNGGRNGSLFINVSVEESDVFRRDGNNVAVTAYVSPATATLGGNADVPTPYGWKKIKIQPGTKSGTKMRMAGCGIKSGSGAGDVVVDVQIEPWQNLTREQRDAVERLRALESENNFKNAASLKGKANAFFAGR